MPGACSTQRRCCRYRSTEQNAQGLGPTLAALAGAASHVVHKMTFDAARVPAFIELLRKEHSFVVAGCEAHVCVCQTVLGLLAAKRHVFVVRDALGARRPESKETAIRRMERHGAEIVTTEMVLFEWVGSAEHRHFRQVLGLLR